MPGNPDAVTATLYVPGVDEFMVQDALAVPFEVSEVAVDGQLTERPEGGFIDVVRDTLPTKLFKLARKADSEEVAPESKLTGLPTVIEKSPMWTVVEAEWTAVPTIAEATEFTRYVLVAVEERVHVSVAVPLAAKTIVVDGHEMDRPVLGTIEEETLTLPVNPKVLESRTEIDDPVAPVLKLTVPLVDIVKSPT